MEYKNKEIYIVCHKEAKDTGEKLNTALSDAGMPAKLSCGNTLGEINAAVINCDAAVFVISESFWKDASLKSVTNKLTGKPSLSCLLENVTLVGGLKYFLEKTEKTDSDISPDEFAGKVKKLLNDAALYKDVIIIADGEDETKAQGIVKKLEESGLSSRIEDYNCDCQEVFNACSAVIIVCGKREENRETEIEKAAKKGHKPCFVHSATYLDSEKQRAKLAAKTISAINKIKPPAHTIVSENIGAIKLLKRPWMKIVLSAVFIQLGLFTVWLASMKSIYYGLIFPILIGAFVFLLIKERKKCSYSKCKNNHNGKKVKVIVGNREASREFKFCGTHENRKDVSAKSKINIYLSIVLVAVTLAFFAFLTVGKVKAEDFTFLDIRRQIELGKPADFIDSGFEAYIREYLHVADESISRKSLFEVKALNFDSNNVKQPIYTLEDLKYFPNLKIFECSDVKIISGDFESFKYTPELQKLDIGLTEIGGDLSSLSELLDLTQLIKSDENDYSRENIYGDISGLKGRGYSNIRLQNTNVYGDISSFEGMDNLFWLNLSYTHVSGNISSLGGMANLGTVYLAKTGVTGDIAVFIGRNMISVDLSETKVQGDISVFEGMQEINLIRLVNCGNITGDLNSVSGLGSLNFLEFDFTDVGGDIGNISELYDLQVLKASEANISGDISVFADKHHLIQVYMDGCRDIYGDIIAFVGLENLEQLGLQGTGVSGNAYELYNNEKIWYLNLSGTDTYSQEEQQNDEITLKSLGFDDNGNFNDAAFGTAIKIESDAFETAAEKAFYCTLRIREKKFKVKITFPDKSHEITFDEKTYVYKPMEFEVTDADFDVEAALSDYIGGDISGIHDEIVCGIDDYCIRRFGVNVDALMEMKYE